MTLKEFFLQTNCKEEEERRVALLSFPEVQIAVRKEYELAKMKQDLFLLTKHDYLKQYDNHKHPRLER